MSNNIQNLVNNYIGRYINKIEIIGHKKSLFIEIRLYAVGQEQYNELFNALSKLNLNNIADMALLAQAKLSAMGIDDKKIEQLQNNALNNAQKK
jgi:hypothetical protein